jgi:hypothetical protein
VLAEHDVRGRQVAVEHPALVGVVDGLADLHEACEQLAECHELLAGGAGVLQVAVEVEHRVAQGLPLDELHRVERAVVTVEAQAVDRHDERVVEAAGDLGLEQEAGPHLSTAGGCVLHLLEGHWRPSASSRARNSSPSPPRACRRRTRRRLVSVNTSPSQEAVSSPPVVPASCVDA